LLLLRKSSLKIIMAPKGTLLRRSGLRRGKQAPWVAFFIARVGKLLLLLQSRVNLAVNGCLFARWESRFAGSPFSSLFFGSPT
jgi:hypothetical protein